MYEKSEEGAMSVRSSAWCAHVCTGEKKRLVARRAQENCRVASCAALALAVATHGVPPGSRPYFDFSGSSG